MEQLTLGQKIAASRKLACLSQENLADKLDVSRQAVSKWESDSTIPDVEKLITLSKLFDVSVGWLLGTETDPSQSSNFSVEQLKTLEGIVAQYQPQKRSWWKYALSGIALVTIIVIFLICSGQISLLKNSNITATQRIEMLAQNNEELQSRLDALATDNVTLKNQLKEVNQLLMQQSENNKLISDFFRIEVKADANLDNVTTVLYMRPKVYQPENTALLSIQNPKTGYASTVECTWSSANQLYIARYTVPAEDGYRISFLLVNEHGFEEENLLIRDPGFAQTGTYCTFHIDPAYSTSADIQAVSYTDGKTTLPDYTFNAPIYSPHIFAETAVAYKDIRIIMEHNGRIIWEKSYLDEFYEAAGGIYLNAGDVSVQPKICIPIPMAQIGDEFKLYLEAETANGGAQTQRYYTLLEHVQIRDIKDLKSDE